MVHVDAYHYAEVPRAPSAAAVTRGPLMAAETMGTWRAQIDVHADPEQVLETLTDVGACEAWSPVGFDIDDLDSGRLRAGTKVAVSGAIIGRRVRFCVEIVRADSERLVLRAVGPVNLVADYFVCPVAAGSRAHAAISVRRGTGGWAHLATRATS